MAKVKTFTSQLKIFHVMNELEEFDGVVNDYIASNGIKKVVSTSDALFSGKEGETIGIVRVLTYED